MIDVKKFTKGSVAFPQKEEAMVFSGASDLPIRNVMIGVTYKHSDYFIRHTETPYFVFEYVLEGEGEIIIGDKKINVTAGDTYVLLAREKLSYRSVPSNPMKKYWINFECDYMAEMLKGYNVTSGVYKTDTLSIFKDLLYVSKSEKPFYEIYSIIAESLHSIVIRAALATRRENNGDAFKLREMLLSAVYKKTTLKEIANELNMSESNVIRVFKKNFGVTPYDFLINAKIDAAKLLLTNTAMSVKEVADRVKISDEHYFSSLFESKTGMRPTTFKKINQQKTT